MGPRGGYRPRPARGRVGSLTACPSAVTLSEVVELLERRYPPALAADWDAVGWPAAIPDASVRRVLFAVDPVADGGRRGAAGAADLIVTHHPLLLRGVHRVAATTTRAASSTA